MFHLRNVHSDIHGGLNNWIEARCPLSSYGCGFAVRRVYPGSDPRASIVYSQEITSFGVRPAPVTSLQGGDDDGGLTLTDLPLELVQLVVQGGPGTLATESTQIATRVGEPSVAASRFSAGGRLSASATRPMDSRKSTQASDSRSRRSICARMWSVWISSISRIEPLFMFAAEDGATFVRIPVQQ